MFASVVSVFASVVVSNASVVSVFASVVWLRHPSASDVVSTASDVVFETCIFGGNICGSEKSHNPKC